MDLFDILLVKKLLSKINSGEAGPEIQEIIKQLEDKVSHDEVKAYVESSVANLPTLSEEELLDILK